MNQTRQVTGPRCPTMMPPGSRFAGVPLSAILTTDLLAEQRTFFRRAPALQRAIAAELDRRAAAKCRRADARTGGAL